MNPEQVGYAIDAAMTLLPAKMNTPDARVMLLAIGMQESRFEHRHQIGGPAHGFWQFERNGGVAGVLKHQATYDDIRRVLGALQYDYDLDTSYEAIVHNDVLAAAYARLLLWTVVGPLPHDDPDAAWHYYLSGWRPGKPHEGTWGNCYQKAQMLCV